jgi:hypothetical protein
MNPLAPKHMKFNEKQETFFVSPRKVIKRHISQGSGFQYADHFNIESLFVYTQE